MLLDKAKSKAKSLGIKGELFLSDRKNKKLKILRDFLVKKIQ